MKEREIGREREKERDRKTEREREKGRQTERERDRYNYYIILQLRNK